MKDAEAMAGAFPSMGKGVCDSAHKCEEQDDRGGGSPLGCWSQQEGYGDDQLDNRQQLACDGGYARRNAEAAQRLTRTGTIKQLADCRHDEYSSKSDPQ